MSSEFECYDNFADDCAEGSVIGTLSTSGHKRVGVDTEGVLSIDNGALRIAPIVEAGFGRAVLAYGPFKKLPGLAFAVYILNGHNTAQAESLPSTFRQRIISWLRGSETDSISERLVQWVRSGRVLRTLRQFRWWKRVAKGARPVPLLNENLAVGWFPTEIVPDPRLQGNTFIMHALGPENGELWAGGPSCRTRSLRGVQNLPLYLVAIVRDEGIVYYVSSVDGASSMAPYPRLRPIAVDHSPLSNELYLGIQQSVLGQIGFRVDTRVEGVRVACVDGYKSWWGGASAADCLTGEGTLEASEAEVGGRWRVILGRAQRDVAGVTSYETDAMAILDLNLPISLMHAMASPGNGAQAKVGLVWRFHNERNHWQLELSRRKCQIVLVENGEYTIMASRELSGCIDSLEHRLQVLDDGIHLMAYVDGEPLSKAWIVGTRFEGETRAGIFLHDQEQGKGAIRSFEVHPRHVSLPDVLDLGFPRLRFGSRVVVADDFTGNAGDIEERLTSVGGKRWSRLMGTGKIGLTGNGAACVWASVQYPCPGRTAYCVDWANPAFADLGITITPPGTECGQKQKSTAGFILYQDPDNYVTLNVWVGDWYPAASVSTFFKFGGFEDVYDAVWSNIGDRVYYGRPSHLRLCCDGERYLVYVNGEPVLYRAFRDVYAEFGRLAIHKVGLIANWEFGTDTGSRFEGFEARV